MGLYHAEFEFNFKCDGKPLEGFAQEIDMI